MKRSFIAFVAAAVLSLVLYWITSDHWVLLGAFLISLHLNFMVLVVTLPNKNPLDKYFEAYWYGVYSLLFGGIGVALWVVLTAVLVIISPLYYLFAGRKYENGYGEKSHKARKPKIAPEIGTAKTSGEFISIKDVPFINAGSDPSSKKR